MAIEHTPDVPNPDKAPPLPASWGLTWIALAALAIAASLLLSWAASTHHYAPDAGCSAANSVKTLNEWASYTLISGWLLSLFGLVLARGWRIYFALLLLPSLYALGVALHVGLSLPPNCPGYFS